MKREIRMAVASIPLAAIVACAPTPPPSEIEAIRAEGIRLRETQPGAPVGGGGSVAQAKAFAATGESEEIDFWLLDSVPSPADMKELRAAFDGAGGRHVQLLKPGEKYSRPSAAATLAVKGELGGKILAAASDRVVAIAPDGKVVWQKRGCGNIHCARRHGEFVYYSNGSLYRVPYGCGEWTRPEPVWKSPKPAGGGVLCFDLAGDSAVLAVNSTCEVVELDLRTLKETVRFPVDARLADGTAPGAHGSLRSVRKTPSGTYLVCCASAQTVREYDRSGKPLRETKIPVFAFDAIVLADGSIAVSHVTGITVYGPDGAVRRTILPSDVPGSANFTSLQELPGGNLVVGSWANGADPSKVVAFEITPDKRPVWTLASPTDVNMMGVTLEK